MIITANDGSFAVYLNGVLQTRVASVDTESGRVQLVQKPLCTYINEEGKLSIATYYKFGFVEIEPLDEASRKFLKR